MSDTLPREYRSDLIEAFVAPYEDQSSLFPVDISSWSSMLTTAGALIPR